MSGDFIESSVKVVGEFGLRENLYYGSIFLCMTLIVIVCFLVINNRAGGGGDGSGTAAAMFDGGECLLQIPCGTGLWFSKSCSSNRVAACIWGD